MLRMGEKLSRRGDFEDVAPSINTTRSAISRANCISWVTTSMVIPLWARVFITCSTSPIISGSSAEVGSSNRIICGDEARARRGHPLLLAAGELRRHLLRFFFQSDLTQQRQRPRLSRAFSQP